MNRSARKLLFAGLIAGLCAAQASATSIRTGDCDLDSSFGIRLDQDAIELTRSERAPHRVRIAEGRLWLDGALQTLSPADQDRIAKIELAIEGLLPQVRAIAVDAVAIATQAIVHVAAFLGEADAAQAGQRAAQIEREFIAKLDRQLNDEGWHAEALEEDIETLAGELAAGVAGDVAALAVRAALSGDETVARDLEARAEQMERALETEVEARAALLEQRTEALCPTLRQIAELDAALELRLSDGSALDLVRM